MVKVTAILIASILTISSTTAFAADVTPTKASPSVDNQAARVMPNYHHRHQMFDDIKLTKQQRQQMRDLMREAKLDRPNFNVAEREAMHKLVTAEKFDETAVYAQAQKMAQDQVKHRVEMARVHNKMYNLLTKEQKSTLEQKHTKRMQQLSNSEQVDWWYGQPGRRSPRM